MQLSKRLLTVARAVTPGHRIADIGTDHGYVPIYLLKNNICPLAIAMDVNRGPLERAKEHIKAETLEHKIKTRLSNGLDKLRPEEVDTVVIAGMGGQLICRILNDVPEFMETGKELVLQPQSEWFKVRHFLHDHGYSILQEWFLKEDGKYYVVIKAVQGGTLSAEFLYCGGDPADLSDGNSTLAYEDEADYQYGYLLIREKNALLLEYLRKERDKKEAIVHAMEKESRTALERYHILRKEITTIDRIIQMYYSIDNSKD